MLRIFYALAYRVMVSSAMNIILRAAAIPVLQVFGRQYGWRLFQKQA
jgi:hypothetical protein